MTNEKFNIYEWKIPIQDFVIIRQEDIVDEFLKSKMFLMLERAVDSNGIKMYKRYNITFDTISYDDEERAKAIEYLEKKYIATGKVSQVPLFVANKEYKKLAPFNLRLIIEELDNDK